MTQLELEGIRHELRFWKDFVKGERFIKGWVPQIKTPELNDYVYNFILEKFYSGFKVLDVGSGVVSILNGTIPKEHITTADPLGGLYEIIFDYKRYNIAPPLPIPAEELSYEGEFDVIHISNALDHSQSPINALQRLFLACKKGGYVIIQGFENEAVYENYSGFHQWNLCISDDCKTLLLSDKTLVTYPLLENPVYAVSFELPTKKRWFIWIHKN